jgi:pyridine nucleotide-disulfide oxidoreductase
MQTWRTEMPADMLLRSAWEETSLCGPDGRGTIDDWSRQTGVPPQHPVPLSLFLDYTAWFEQSFVHHPRAGDVVGMEPHQQGLRIESADGTAVTARRAVIAVGVLPFRYVPAPLAPLVGEGVGYTGATIEYSLYRDRRVMVVGAGQGGLETAARLAAAGAHSVEVITRRSVRWFADREPDVARQGLRSKIHQLAYPVLGYGPPGINRLATAPGLLEHMPASFRRAVTRRALRSGGSPWIRHLYDAAGVYTTTGAEVTFADHRAGELRLGLSDGTERRCDDVLVATGFRFSLDRLGFLSPALQRGIRTTGGGWPVLDSTFRSTDARVFFVGYPAEGRFGPVARFVLGTRFTCDRLGRVVGGPPGATAPDHPGADRHTTSPASRVARPS